jgi:hypothetical protein
MIERRGLLGGLVLAAAVGSVGPVRAAPPDARLYRVGVLRAGSAPISPADPQQVALPNALRELGYAEGRNLVIDRRHADNDLARLPGDRDVADGRAVEETANALGIAITPALRLLIDEVIE